MSDSRAASRYIRSLLELSIEQGAVEQVHTDLLTFSKVAEGSRALKLMLRNPIIKHDTKRAILAKIFKGKVHSLTMAIFDILTRKNREPLLPEIARGFHHAYNEIKGIGEATVTTAVPLDPSLRKDIEKLVKKYSDKKEVDLIEKVDPSMIGGFVLNIGDRQIDASISSKLKTLQVQFSQNPYIKEI